MRMRCFDFGEKKLGLVQSFTAYSLCSWKFCFKVSQCPLLWWSSRWAKRSVKFRIPINLQMPLLLKTYLLLGSRVFPSTDLQLEKRKYQCYEKYLRDFHHTIAVEIHIKILNSKQGTCREGILKRTGTQSRLWEFNSLSSTKESWELVQILLENIPQSK